MSFCLCMVLTRCWVRFAREIFFFFFQAEDGIRDAQESRGLGEGGELHTIEANDELEPIASKYFIRSGLSGRITLHIGSALDIAPSLGVFDLIFIDGDKREYPQYYDMALSHLVRSGSYLLADNILWYGKVAETVPVGDRHTWAIREFNDRVLQDDRVENVILPIRDGLNLIRVK